MPIARSMLWLLLSLLVLPLACAHDEGPPPAGGNGGPSDDELPTPQIVCPAYAANAYPEMAPLAPEKATAIGAIDGKLSISSIGSPRYSIPLQVPPGRRLVPQLEIVVDNHADGILGKGVGLSGLSVIHRCGSNLAQDEQIRGVELNSNDHYCLDGSRLISIGTGKDSIGSFSEYRLWPDAHTKVLGYGAPSANGFDVTYFVAYLLNGNIVHYGKSANARAVWRGVTRAWNKEFEMDRRGNTIRYKYAALSDPKSPTTQEMVLDQIRYTGFIDDKGNETFGNRVVDFVYDEDDRYGKLFYEGEELSRRNRLVKIDMTVSGSTVQSYRFNYDDDLLTHRSLLSHVDECAQGDLSQCKPATRFDWQKGTSGGFSSHATWTNVPSKNDDDQFSWTVADVTGDGAPDIVTSTRHPDSGMNRWFVYENVGNGSFGTPIEWFSAPFPQGFSRQWQIIPVDENGDGRVDLLIDQPDGTAWNTLHVLRSVAEPSPHFELVATAIPRTSQHRASEFTVESHSGFTVADIDADGMSDVITCRELRTWYGQSEYVPDDCDVGEECKPSLARWSAHLWRRNGFESTERHIEALDGVSCWTMSRFFGAVDWNADGQTDLVTASKKGMWQVHTLRVPSLQWESQELSMALANALGVQVWDDPVANMVVFPLTTIRAEQMENEWEPLRAFFPDLNGDSYPDLLYTGSRGTTTKPFVAINEGRDEYTGFLFPYDTVEGNSQTFAYSPFARVFDYSGDGRDDLILPVGGACADGGDSTCYVIFESGRVGEPTKVVKTNVPFENPITDSVAPQYLIRTADVNLDGLIDLLDPGISSQMRVFENQSKPNLLMSITTGRSPLDPSDPGFLPDIAFEYGNLVDAGAGAPESATYITRSDANNGCEYPRACVAGGMPVVAAYTQNNGQNQKRRSTMHYRDGRVHRHGRGFLGFGEVETRDVDTGVVTQQRFDNVTFDETFKTYPFAGIPFETRMTMPIDGVALESSTTATYAVQPTNGGKTYFLAAQSTEKVRKQNADVLERSWTVIDDLDDYGNVLASRSGTDGIDLITATSREVKNDSAAWLLGLVEGEETCSTSLGETRCRKSLIRFNARGEPERIERGPNDPTAHLVTYLLRDQYGNTTNVIAGDDLGNHRESCVTFEPSGTFPWAMRNGAGHTSHVLYDPGWGVPLSTRDANGLVSKSRFDGFGLTVEERAPEGLITTIARSRVKSGVWTTRVMESTPGHGASEMAFDAFARPIQMRERGPDVDTAGISSFGKSLWIVQDQRYDLLGRVEWRSIPRIDGDAIAEINGSTFEYDNAGRITKSVTPWGTTTRTYDHDKVTTIEKGPEGISSITTTTKMDSLGRPIVVTDAKQGITRRVYGPFGELRRVELPDGTARETTQDDYGRDILDDDPDRGKTVLEYDGFDEVVKLHDAADRHYAFKHDAVGRLVQRSEGLNVSTYEFDTATNGLGLPARMTGADGHIEEYEYDTKSRAKKTTLRLADGRTFEHSLMYDSFSRVERIEYPHAFSVVRHYDSTGTLVEIRNGSTRAPVWHLDMVNAAGQTMLEGFANGATTERVYEDGSNLLETIFTTAGGKTLQSLRYDYDAQLNVKSRFDARQGKRESFGHDALNRVTCTHVDSCAPGNICNDVQVPCDVEVQYGPTGDITLKSDVGAYVPDPLHPHAVKSAGSQQFGYDAVGNQIDRPNETISYTDFDLPRQYIPKSGGASTTFEYNATGERVRRLRGETETIYWGDLYEQETNGNAITERFYVHGDERAIAVVERLSSGDAWHFIHSDHLGSVDVISGDGGVEIDRRSFDAWGAPRNPKWGANGPASSNAFTRRGFTWHESDEEVGLVNAKGRIYDPTIARFLQTDPIISDPLSAQTYNPYNYARNRPLVFRDPSGFADEPVVVDPLTAFVMVLVCGLVCDAPPNATGGSGPGNGTKPPSASEINMHAGPPSTAAPLPSEPEALSQPSPQSRTGWDGVRDGLVDLYHHADEMVPGSTASTVGTVRSVAEAVDAYKKGDAIDAINVVNPAMPFARLGFAIDEGDWYTVGRESVAVGVTIVATIATRKLGSANAKIPKRGIYEFSDQTASGVPYVGQSGNIEGRLARHIRDGRLTPGTEVTQVVEGGKLAREIAEHQRIQEITEGIPARNSPKVSNKVDPIGPNRRHLLDNQ